MPNVTQKTIEWLDNLESNLGLVQMLDAMPNDFDGRFGIAEMGDEYDKMRLALERLTVAAWALTRHAAIDANMASDPLCIECVDAAMVARRVLAGEL